MKCPACGNALSELMVANLTLDACRDGCGGIWFDRFELGKLDEPHEPMGEELANVRKGEGIRVDPSKRRRCPRCGDVVLMRHDFSVKREVEVDECPGCAGFWLDQGELATIRGLFESEEERDEAAERYFSGVFDEPLESLRAEEDARRKSARRFARLLRFLCPSYYVPGRQKWGAF